MTTSDGGQPKRAQPRDGSEQVAPAGWQRDPTERQPRSSVARPRLISVEVVAISRTDDLTPSPPFSEAEKQWAIDNAPSPYELADTG
jgi:hypothetical protein